MTWRVVVACDQRMAGRDGRERAGDENCVEGRGRGATIATEWAVGEMVRSGDARTSSARDDVGADADRLSRRNRGLCGDLRGHGRSRRRRQRDDDDVADHERRRHQGDLESVARQCIVRDQQSRQGLRGALERVQFLCAVQEDDGPVQVAQPGRICRSICRRCHAHPQRWRLYVHAGGRRVGCKGFVRAGYHPGLRQHQRRFGRCQRRRGR